MAGQRLKDILGDSLDGSSGQLGTLQANVDKLDTHFTDLEKQVSLLESNLVPLGNYIKMLLKKREEATAETDAATEIGRAHV